MSAGNAAAPGVESGGGRVDLRGRAISSQDTARRGRFPLSPHGRPEDPEFVITRTTPRDLVATMQSIVMQLARWHGLIAGRRVRDDDSLGAWVVLRLTDHGFDVLSDHLTTAEAAAFIQLQPVVPRGGA